jgi:hypothetical protein
LSYLLDANVFIQAKNLHYGLDFCPAFWQWLIDQNEAGLVFTIDKVADEITAGSDELSIWMVSQKPGFFRKTGASIMPMFAQVSSWVMSQGYEPAAVSTFMQVADYYLVAHALSGSFTVVTHEVPANSAKRIKIPHVCAGLNLHFMTPYEMLRKEKARFVLGDKR